MGGLWGRGDSISDSGVANRPPPLPGCTPSPPPPRAAASLTAPEVEVEVAGDAVVKGRPPPWGWVVGAGIEKGEAPLLLRTYASNDVSVPTSAMPKPMMLSVDSSTACAYLLYVHQHTVEGKQMVSSP